MRVTVLAGGTGAAKFVRGLARVIPASAITVIVNTGDDLEWWGLSVSPDIDTICYELAGLLDMERGWGRVVNIASNAGVSGYGYTAAYCAAKHAMVGFTDSLRSELIHDGSHVRLTVVHMPALNTPQFSWCKSRMPRKAQPVPPIFQPEVGAEAVYWAAHHDRRELLVGWPTIQAVWGQKVIPGLLDRYLARMAWDGQMYDGARDPGSPVDLYEPVPGHQSAHGDFDDRAADRSLALWAETHRGWLAAGVGAVAAGAAALLWGACKAATDA